MERTWNVNADGTLSGYAEIAGSTELMDGTKHSMLFRFDLTGLTLDGLMAPALASWKISAQRPVRTVPADDVRAMKRWDAMAVTPGAKPITRGERIARMVATGMPEKLAVMSIDDPKRFNELMAMVGEG